MRVLEVKGLRKQFGDQTVLEDVSFTIPSQCIFGFLGQNGAGKTTTMKLILGLLKATSGEIFVCGEPVVYGNTKTNRLIGYLPDVPEFYAYMTPREYLLLCAEVTGLPKHVIKDRCDELLDLVGLSNVNRRIGGFSRGMKQRLGIAQALLNNPTLLICDEPTSALDPVGRKEILDVLLKVKEQTTVLFSTHILSDVEQICDQIAILHEGKLVLTGDLLTLKKQFAPRQIQLEFKDAAHANEVHSLLLNEARIQKINQQATMLNVEVNDLEGDGQHLLKSILEARIPIYQFKVVEPSLESLFMEVIGCEPMLPL